MKPQRLFHLADPAAWSRFADAPVASYIPPGFDAAGFVHLSFAEQLAGTLALHFARSDRIVLVELDRTAVAAELRLEPSRDGQRFPHLYRPIERADCIGAWSLQRGAEGWNVPQLAGDPADDRPPPGSPWAP